MGVQSWCQLLVIPIILFFNPCSPVDQYGFHRPDDFDYDSYDHFMSSYLAVLARRATRWSQFMKGSSKVKKSRKG